MEMICATKSRHATVQDSDGWLEPSGSVSCATDIALDLAYTKKSLFKKCRLFA